MKKFFSDFKKFISRGNIVDMAIGVIIGSAFSSIVKALTDKIIMPFINYLLSLGGSGLSSAYSFLKTAYDTNGEIDLANSIYIDWGAFITAILNFFIIALTLFIILKVAMKSSEMLKNAKEKAIKEKLTKQERKELRAKGVKLTDKEAIKEYREEKQRIQEEERLKLEEEQKAKAEEEARLNPSEKELLKEIRDLLKANVK